MRTWNPDDYRLSMPGDADPAIAEAAFDRAWRHDFDRPGFALIDLGPNTSSLAMRSRMVELKDRLNEIAERRGSQRFRFRSAARFDQQETTKFHLDGAPAESMLMLGYEPSEVRSRLFLADYSRAAFELDITPQRFLADYNPMFRAGENRLTPYVTETPWETGRATIVLINNSSLPCDGRHPLGVLHKAVIVTPDATRQRIINSTMLTTEGDELDESKLREFVTTDAISRKNY
jgi:hypothetical protein